MLSRRRVYEILSLVLESQYRVEAKVNRLLRMELSDARRDQMASAGQERLSQEIREIREAVDKFTTEQGDRANRAVEAAKKAWEQDNETAFNQAADELQAIADKLVQEDGSSFSPSANV